MISKWETSLKRVSFLSTNTTADKHAGFDTSEIPDFFNQYGDAVVEQVLSEYPEINERLDYPITVNPDGIASLEDATEGAIAKVTGRLPLLSVAEQESFSRRRRSCRRDLEGYALKRAEKPAKSLFPCRHPVPCSR